MKHIFHNGIRINPEKIEAWEPIEYTLNTNTERSVAHYKIKIYLTCHTLELRFGVDKNAMDVMIKKLEYNT